jgi:hypothetical protein
LRECSASKSAMPKHDRLTVDDEAPLPRSTDSGRFNRSRLW